MKPIEKKQVSASETQLLLDSRIVAEAKNLHLELGAVQKSTNNPLFKEDFFADPPKNWEARYDNVYPNVLYNEKEALYKCWYSAFLIDSPSNNTPLEQRKHVPYDDPEPEREDGLLYAESEDGIIWRKPNLGIVTFKGSSENNIVMSLTSHGLHAGGVLRDLADKDPSRRYKFLHSNITAKRMAVAFSEDGLHWSTPIPWPEHNAIGDCHNNALWSVELGKYVGITRGWEGTVNDNEGNRTVLRTESEDFIHWSEPVEVLKGENLHDQIYSMPIFRYGNLYLGLPSIFHKGDPNAADWDTVSTELAWSPDTRVWHRICQGEALIPRGEGSYPDGAYDCGCVYAGAPVIQADSMLLYYGGSNGLHNGWREGSFNLATLPRDHFAGYRQHDPSETGVLRTTELIAHAEDLTLNADISEGGWLQVSIFDQSGAPLPAYQNLECLPAGNSLALSVDWQDKAFSELAGKRICLEFKLKAAKLYAFTGCQLA